MVVRGTTFSFGPDGMFVGTEASQEDEDDRSYEIRNLSFRSARVYSLDAAEEEIEQVLEVLSEHDSEYDWQSNNCVTPVVDSLAAIGVSVRRRPISPVALGRLLDGTPEVVSVRTIHSTQAREGGAPWNPVFPTP